MKNITTDVSAGHARPSRLIAEALVLGHNSVEVIQRAKAMGLPESLTQAVVMVCCKDQQESSLAAAMDGAD